MLSLADAAKTLPFRRSGKRPNISTLYRWALRGIRSIRLETVLIGGQRCTSKEALARFFQRLTREAGGDADTPTFPAVRSAARRERAAARASEELERLGA
ncbi:MAG: DUF1580 domain-containing protein [Planctomycetaceae bacterium]|nr:DUF1580 domain-containing protein [Planctomycetaceae bacterium]